MCLPESAGASTYLTGTRGCKDLTSGKLADALTGGPSCLRAGRGRCLLFIFCPRERSPAQVWALLSRVRVNGSPLSLLL